MKVPADVYKKSEIKYHGEHIELRYTKSCKTRYVDAPMEIWFSNIILGKINPDNWLFEPEYNSVKFVFKS